MQSIQEQADSHSLTVEQWTNAVIAKAVTKASKPEKSKPVQLPQPIAERLRRVCEVADVDPSDFIASIIGEWIEDESIADLLIDGWQITDHGTIAEIYRVATGAAPIIQFPNAKPRLMESPPPESGKTHGIALHPSSDELDAWGRAAMANAMTFSQWALATIKAATTKPAARKMCCNALPPGPRHQIPIMFTEADDKAFREQAKACGVPVEIWAHKTLEAALTGKGGQA